MANKKSKLKSTEKQECIISKEEAIKNLKHHNSVFPEFSIPKINKDNNQKEDAKS